MIDSSQLRSGVRGSAFSLIEMVVVIAVLSVLMGVGMSFFKDTGAQSRKVGTEFLRSMIEQARTKAITSRAPVFLAIAEPGDFESSENECRVGLFSVAASSDFSVSLQPLQAKLMRRWHSLPLGVILIPGGLEGSPNPLDHAEVELVYGVEKMQRIKVHGMAFDARGGLLYPLGAEPVEIRIAEGAYRGSPKKAHAKPQGVSGKVMENRLKIGRVIARSYPVDG